MIGRLFEFPKPLRLLSCCYGGNPVRVIALFLMMLASLPAFAQSNYAELSGTVLDPERAAIVGASIQVTSVSTHVHGDLLQHRHPLFGKA